ISSSLTRPLYSLSSLSFKQPSPSAIYTLSLHDALPISGALRHPRDGIRARPEFPRHLAGVAARSVPVRAAALRLDREPSVFPARSEEHTSELQSLRHLVCRLLLEKKKE